MDGIKNFAKVTVDGLYEDTETEIDVIASDGVKLPDAPFNAVWWNATDYPDPSDDPSKEIIRVTDVTSDTLTIVRGQEGTDAVEHGGLGKTHKLIAGPTKKTIDDLIALLGDVFGSDTAIIVDVGSNLITLRQSGSACMVQLAALGVEIQGPQVSVGDVEGEGSFTFLTVDDTNTRILLRGFLATNQIASASVAPGTLVGKVPWYDDDNNLIGYMPLYGSIT